MFKRLFIVIVLIICFTYLPFISAKADEVFLKKGDILTLDDCINFAIQKNPNINRSSYYSKVYQSKKSQIKSSLFPQINISSGYSRQNPSTNSGFDKTNNQYSGSVGLTQLIYDFGKTPTKMKIQDFNIDASNFELENTVIQVAYNVKQAYYSALAAKVSKDIYDRSIKQCEQHLKQAKSFFQAGIKSKIDVTTAEVNLSNAKFNYIKADSTFKNAMANLNNAMGIPDAPEYSIADTLTYNNHEIFKDNEKQVKHKNSEKPFSSNDNQKTLLKSKVSKNDIIENLTFKKYDIAFEDALKIAFESRPDLKSLITKGKMANESVKLAKKDYLPNISGFANYGFGGQEFPLDNGWSFGANISIPVFNGFLTKNQIDEARANLDIANSDVEILRQNIYLQVQQAYINLIEAEKRIPVANITVKQAKENLELANGRYNVGVGNFIEVQDAETSYNNAQLSYVQALYDYNIARSNLEKAMGVR